MFIEDIDKVIITQQNENMFYTFAPDNKFYIKTNDDIITTMMHEVLNKEPPQKNQMLNLGSFSSNLTVIMVTKLIMASFVFIDIIVFPIILAVKYNSFLVWVMSATFFFSVAVFLYILFYNLPIFPVQLGDLFFSQKKIDFF